MAAPGLTAAFLNDVHLLASTNIRWRLARGVDPVVETFQIRSQDVPKLSGAQAPAIDGVTLKIESPGGTSEYKKLSILGFSPSNVPDNFIQNVTVSDRRWTWPYTWILRRFNMRRNAGFRRRASWSGALVNIASGFIAREVQFHKWSLKNQNTEWKADEALEDMLTAGDALGIDPTDIVKDTYFLKELKKLRFDDSVFDDAGHNAIRRILAMIPGADVYIDPEGRIHLFSIADGGEAAMLNAGGPSIVSGPQVSLVTNEQTRPSQVIVYFTVECELRFDHTEDQTDVSRTVDATGPDPRDMDNVLAIPDPIITLKNGERFAQGTWIKFNEYLQTTVINAGRGLLASLGLTSWHRVLRQAVAVPDINLWSSLALAGNTGSGADELAWSARLSAFQTHYRRTYRINKNWMDKILSIRPYLIATIDTTTGQRAPAAVFSDWAIRSSFKALVNKANNRDLCYASNYSGYPTGDSLDTGQRAPAFVDILDADQGIIRINYQVDPFNMADVVFPSKVDNSPCLKISKSRRDASTPLTFESVAANDNDVPILSANHSVSVVLTATPASPNDKRQLYAVPVDPSEVKDRLPPAMRAGLDNANGPVKEVRVNAGLETARIRWQDEKKLEIEKIFGNQPGVANLADLVINDIPATFGGFVRRAANIFKGAFGGAALGAPQGAASLREIARSIAASIYAAEHDRYMGGRTVTMNSGLRPAGNLGEVTHELQTNGILISTMSLPSKIEPISIFAFMDEGTRQIVLREVQPSKGP